MDILNLAGWPHSSPLSSLPITLQTIHVLKSPLKAGCSYSPWLIFCNWKKSDRALLSRFTFFPLLMLSWTVQKSHFNSLPPELNQDMKKLASNRTTAPQFFLSRAGWLEGSHPALELLESVLMEPRRKNEGNGIWNGFATGETKIISLFQETTPVPLPHIRNWSVFFPMRAKGCCTCHNWML